MRIVTLASLDLAGSSQWTINRERNAILTAVKGHIIIHVFSKFKKRSRDLEDWGIMDFQEFRNLDLLGLTIFSYVDWWLEPTGHGIGTDWSGN